MDCAPLGHCKICFQSALQVLAQSFSVLQHDFKVLIAELDLFCLINVMFRANMFPLPVNIPIYTS